MKRYYLLGMIFVSMLLVSNVPTTSALLGLDVAKIDESSRQRAETEPATPPEQNRRDDSAGNVLNAAIGDEVEQKRLELQQKIEARRAAVSEKLDGKRADVCEKREQAINQELANRTAAAERYLEKFKTIHARLTDFATKHSITIENANALLLIMDDKKGDAEATIATAKLSSFDCAITSAATPGSIMRGLIAEEKLTLQQYRDSIKEYATALKTAASTSVDHQKEQGQ
jgi:hypothetical protein